MLGDDTKKKLERLVERFFTGRVVPFIGAGVSISAVHKDGRTGLANSSPMIEAIVSKLHKTRIHDEKNKWARWCCEFLECDIIDQGKCREDACLLKQLSNPAQSEKYLKKYATLDKLCEIFTWVMGQDGQDGKGEVCQNGKVGSKNSQGGRAWGTETNQAIQSGQQYQASQNIQTIQEPQDLQEVNRPALSKLVYDVLLIPEFSELQPQPAHRYISFLAREQLIDEIITTNYDCCFETAYRQTFQGRPEDTALVITDLDEYRRYSGRFYTDNGERCLKIYKINGCADKLKQNRLQQNNYPPEKILLMERQLQNWRGRGWARDLFHDCLRSRTLLFSGFGSEEPQVRHTALQISEEFQNTGEHKAETKQASCWDLPNAPFISAYESILSFNQIQILYSYASAHNSSLDFDHLHSNVFTGADIEFFDPQASIRDNKAIDKDRQKLPADLFWEKVYQAAFWQLFKEHCKPDSTFYAYLSSRIYTKDALLFEFISWLVPDDKPTGRFPKMLELDSDGVNTLTRWLNCIRYGRTSCLPGLYLPLVEKPLLLPLMLLILFFAAGDKGDWDEINGMVELENGLFLLKTAQELPVYIVYDTALLENALNNCGSVKDVGFAIIIDEKLEEHPGVIYKTAHTDLKSRGNLRRKKRVCIYKLPIRDIFHWSSNLSVSIDTPGKKFFAALREAKLITADACPRVRKRAKRI